MNDVTDIESRPLRESVPTPDQLKVQGTEQTPVVWLSSPTTPFKLKQTIAVRLLPHVVPDDATMAQMYFNDASYPYDVDRIMVSGREGGKPGVLRVVLQQLLERCQALQQQTQNTVILGEDADLTRLFSPMMDNIVTAARSVLVSADGVTIPANVSATAFASTESQPATLNMVFSVCVLVSAATAHKAVVTLNRFIARQSSAISINVGVATPDTRDGGLSFLGTLNELLSEVNVWTDVGPTPDGRLTNYYVTDFSTVER